MTKTRTFSYARDDVEEVNFVLNGYVIDCVDEMSGMTLLDFAIMSTPGEDGTPSAQSAVAAKEFLKAAIQPNSWDEFLVACEVKGAVVGAEQLGEIAEWLTEVYSGGNPTPSSSTSSGGSTATGPTSPAELSTVPA